MLSTNAKLQIIFSNEQKRRLFLLTKIRGPCCWGKGLLTPHPLFLSDYVIDGVDKNLVLVLLLFCEVVEGHDVGMEEPLLVGL